MGNEVDFDDYVDEYNQILNDSTKFFSPNEEYFARYKIDLMRKKISTPIDSVYEFGCGIGRNIPFLQEAFPGAETYGSDISEKSLELARELNPDVYIFQETSDEVPGLTYDLIFVAGVFHHIPVDQRQDIMNVLYERLNPNGHLFIFEHNPYNPLTRHIVNNCPYDEDAVLLRPKELKGLIKSSKLALHKSEYCLFIPPKLSLLAPLEAYLGWLPLGGQYWVHASKTL